MLNGQLAVTKFTLVERVLIQGPGPPTTLNTPGRDSPRSGSDASWWCDDRDMAEIHRADLTEMDDEDQHKEVYSYAGLALYFAQVVEQSLVQLIVVTQIAEGKLDPSLAEYDKLVDRLDKKTLGQALHTARMYTQLSDEQEAMVTEALRLRNFVAHSFFRERIELFLTETGRRLMCDELADAAEQFARTDELLTESMFALGIALGLTRERAEERLEAMKSHWRDG